MRIFVAAPRDVTNYREAAVRVTERLNQENDAKLSTPGYLEVVDWNRHIASYQDMPESELLDELELAEDDVFLGMAWLAFDAGGVDENTTERNFALAFEAWRRHHPQTCLLCRCMRLPEKLTDINGRAFDRIGRFFARFAIGGRNPVPYYEFDSATDLEEYLVTRFASHLAPLLAQAAAEPEPVAEPEPAPTVEPTTEFERKMQAGKAYEVSFLSIEIANDPVLDSAVAANPGGKAVLESSFRELVASIAANYGGEVFTWQGGGGLLIFWNNRSFDHAIMTGLKVLHNLPVFNLDPDQNPLAINIKTRAAAHDAVIIFQLPASKIRSTDIDYVIELQTEHTDAGELSITRRLIERIDKRLRPHFKFKDRFEGEQVYVCRLPSSESGPDTHGLEDYRKRLEQYGATVEKVLAASPTEIDIAALEGLSKAIDEAYSNLNKFCTAFSAVDANWRPEMYLDLAHASEGLMEREQGIWTTLRKAYISGRFSAGKARQLETIVKTAARRRARPVVILEKLVERCRSMAETGHEETPKAPVEDDLLKRVGAFIRADILDVETALTELLLHHKSNFLDFVSRKDSGEPGAKALDKLWSAADLALLDDLYSIRGRQRANERKVFDVLVSPETGDHRFRMVRQLLASDSLDEEAVRQGLANGREVTAEDLQIVWRCLVLGHRNLEVRQRAAFKLSSQSMWQAISHPSIPISSIQAIGERVYRVEGEDAQKVFFDCTRARIESAVEAARGNDELAAVTKLMLLLMNFGFLVETGYFERFDDLLRKLLEVAQKQNFKVDYFENLRKTLDEARKQNPDKGPSKPPQGIQKLPLTIQRRLASESRYVYWFVSHPDPRIARETLRHVGLMHIERVLSLREVNVAVMNALLRKPELFTRGQAVLAALNHPKCTQEFATRHIPTLARSRQGVTALGKLVNNPSANPAVRSAAKRAISGRARAGAK